MFFFLRPNFKSDSFWAKYIPLPILFFLFPFATISFDLWEEEYIRDDYWILLEEK